VTAGETPIEEFDVAIIGGGMVGASLAQMLAALPLTVAVVEATPVESTAQPSFDARTTALSNGTKRIFTTLGLWESLAAEATPIRAIHISERGRFGRSVIDAAEQGLDAMGYVLANRAIGRELWRRLKLAPAISLIEPARVLTLATQATFIELELQTREGSRALRARLVVAADGANSLVRSQAGIGASHRDYEQTAVVTSVSPSRYHANVAYERFTDEGPVAVLPQADGRCAVILTLPCAAAQAAIELTEQQFLALLQRRFGWRLGEFSALGRRDAYPLELTAAEASHAARVALIGSAAQGLHPIAGQGFNLGLRDAATLAEVISDACLGEGPSVDVGAESVLSRFASSRARDRRALIRFTDGLVRLFASPLLPLRFARSLGLLAFDVSPAAKAAMAGLSRGFAAEEPRLARGLDLSGDGPT
jgi:2-octaprenyl-6-methoxyphenol hydroxylase